MGADFEVYVHVPFCLRRCGYCDFNTYTASDLGAGASRANYARMAAREMELVYDWQCAYGIAEPAASTVFFGGGTPTVLSPDDLVFLVERIRTLWGIAPGAEITTEANPDTVDETAIDRLAAGGFTRISFGMQSAVPHVLRTLDRTHTPAHVTRGVRAAQAAGLDASVDLIYGAPGESLDDWRTSVRSALDLGVLHLSAYALTVEPTTAMGRRIAAGTLPKPDDDDEAAKYEIVDAMAQAVGLEWYEISNWAAPGHESRHNLGYWRNVDWAGIGPGAHSHYRLPAGGDDGGGGRAVRAWDTLHPRRWGQQINEGQVPFADHESIDPQADLEETIMLGLRLREGLDLQAVQARTGTDLAPVVHALTGDGLVTCTQGRITPTLRGRLLNDTVIQRVFSAVLH
ncbi:oxygen-independent coproporphyrinogen III oxidase [Bifidobacterium pseudolongum subsp. globosum]|uniref:Heme chaperone HemW n=1 Tax=Bifidobacterium pseudolongum subsp. globosum TaxID=1690 RepID=A0A2N3QU58_9BIFI|nr:radical SAM family heme chaperone HemW [Bifidobacterium pseudolongum]KFI78735.1 oxygen-independent coproporphyrinogen III oxidase [Bifidobacterium pseudolongum subsp. globosum]PKU95607.1 oxygen-independent coproporphyrinogen III oxidase [Bifidobacterium pseudolongum subsp. globosum]PKV02953.1 oxygen-independent coproporphyrinogen III oxidase [Bifidobacterium pseudolongum subsp. globosum]RYQ00757.1 oxygen-independent coproporphyrinogen III oxidase [Bifidobacterium pseudolongum subsp. globosum